MTDKATWEPLSTKESEKGGHLTGRRALRIELRLWLIVIIIPLTSRAINCDKISDRSKSAESGYQHGRIDNSNPNRWNSDIENKTNGLCGADVLKPYEVTKRYFLHEEGFTYEKKKASVSIWNQIYIMSEEIQRKVTISRSGSK